MIAGSPFGMDYYSGSKVQHYLGGMTFSLLFFCLDGGKVFAGMLLAAMIAGLL